MWSASLRVQDVVPDFVDGTTAVVMQGQSLPVDLSEVVIERRDGCKAIVTVACRDEHVSNRFVGGVALGGAFFEHGDIVTARRFRWSEPFSVFIEGSRYRGRCGFAPYGISGWPCHVQKGSLVRVRFGDGKSIDRLITEARAYELFTGSIGNVGGVAHMTVAIEGP